MVTWPIIAGLILATGCADKERCRVARDKTPPAVIWRVEAPQRPTPNLLFDRDQGPSQPGRPPLTAEDFAYRDTWPSTSGYYVGGEAVFYREWYYDNQGDGFNNFNHLTRQFQAYRYGVKFR